MIEKTKWYRLSENDSLKQLDTTLEGLSPQEASKRLSTYGPNELPAKKPLSVLQIFIHQFKSPLIYILLLAGIASLIIDEPVDAAFIFVVLLLNAGIGTFQEWKADRSANALQQLLEIKSQVIRGGQELTLPAKEIVPGDIVLLESGNKVPADLRLIRAVQLAADESFLTGESVASDKQVHLLDEEKAVSDQSNMSFAGSIVTKGRGTGVVVATGLTTEVGMISQYVTGADESKPPLLIRMERFAHQISYVVLGACAVLMIILLYQGYSWATVFFLAVALAVSAIPEGLPVAMTVALSIATSRMSKRNVIVRKLTAVESLGSCTMIASDKTGTLTVNEQTVKSIWLPSAKLFSVSGEGYNGNGTVLGEGGSLDAQTKEELQQLAAISMICNEAELDKDGDQWTHKGDAMDVAFLAMGYKLGLHPQEVRKTLDVAADIPYESERKYAARFIRENDHIKAAVKGAVEVLLDFSETMKVDGETVPLDRTLIEEHAFQLASQGYRVLAVADGDVQGDAVEEGNPQMPKLRLLGLVGFIDPLRPEAIDAIAKCREAGVQVIMITGDHPATAMAISKEIGLITNEQGKVATGDELEKLYNQDMQAFLNAVQETRVFARVTPIQKLQIVDALMKMDHYVAVTGDGVNDAPALRRASIGVAMGSGTDVAKDTGSMIVTDDNFSSIVAGIEEGRYAYSNVRKVIYLVISTGVAEVLLFLLAVSFGLPLPLLAVQLLWLNLVTNGIQDVSLAFEGGEPGVMKQKPRKPSEGIFNKRMIGQSLWSGLTMSVVSFIAFYWLLDLGWEPAAASNMVLLLMVLFQNFHVFNCRSEYVSIFRIPLKRNVILVIGVLAAQGLHIAAMHIPFMQSLLRMNPVSFMEWIMVCAAAASIIVVMELYKALTKN